MKIQVGGLSEGVHRYQFLVPGAELDIGVEFHDDVKVEATLEKTGAQFFLSASIETSGHFACDRCVTEFSILFDPSYRMFYAQEGADSTQWDPAEVHVVTSGLNVIDIAEDVRQTILLSVPLKLLCRDDCKGLCPHCGKNSNHESCSCTDAIPDSRWEKLQSLQKNNFT